jgi:hypothetical protein
MSQHLHLVFQIAIALAALAVLVCPLVRRCDGMSLGSGEGQFH